MMDDQLIDRCCISDDEAHKMMQEYENRMNNKVNELVIEHLCNMKEQIENLKKQNEVLKCLAFPEAMPVPVPFYGNKLLPSCCDCGDISFMKKITNTDSEA